MLDVLITSGVHCLKTLSEDRAKTDLVKSSSHRPASFLFSFLAVKYEVLIPEIVGFANFSFIRP